MVAFQPCWNTQNTIQGIQGPKYLSDSHGLQFQQTAWAIPSIMTSSEQKHVCGENVQDAPCKTKHSTPTMYIFEKPKKHNTGDYHRPTAAHLSSSTEASPKREQSKDPMHVSPAPQSTDIFWRVKRAWTCVDPLNHLVADIKKRLHQIILFWKQYIPLIHTMTKVFHIISCYSSPSCTSYATFIKKVIL